MSWPARAAARLDAAAVPLARWLTAVAALCLAIMAGLTVVDVLGRYLLNRPLPGTLELSEFALALVVFLGLGATGVQGTQVVVDLLVERLPRRPRALVDALNALLGFGFWGLVAWQGAAQGLVLWQKAEVSTILGLPAAPFIWATAVGSGVMALALVGRTFHALGRAPGRTAPR